MMKGSEAILERIGEMSKLHQDRLEEIDRKLAAIMQVQDAELARLSALQDQLDVLVPPPEGSVSKYRS